MSWSHGSRIAQQQQLGLGREFQQNQTRDTRSLFKKENLLSIYFTLGFKDHSFSNYREKVWQALNSFFLAPFQAQLSECCWHVILIWYKANYNGPWSQSNLKFSLGSPLEKNTRLRPTRFSLARFLVYISYSDDLEHNALMIFGGGKKTRYDLLWR